MLQKAHNKHIHWELMYTTKALLNIYVAYTIHTLLHWSSLHSTLVWDLFYISFHRLVQMPVNLLGCLTIYKSNICISSRRARARVRSCDIICTCEICNVYITGCKFYVILNTYSSISMVSNQYYSMPDYLIQL